jgi:hypothetical protein
MFAKLQAEHVADASQNDSTANPIAGVSIEDPSQIT